MSFREEEVKIGQLMDYLVEAYCLNRKASRDPFVPGKTRIDLACPTFGHEEICEALHSLMSLRLTMGDKVKMFEQAFAGYIGVKHAVMVNSGSSANLLTMSMLTNPSSPYRIFPGDEVITPAVTFATTVYPICQVGAVPVLVDVSRDTMNIDVAEIERALTAKTKAIMLVHLMGNPCDMPAILEVARLNDLTVIEDTCESHGASIDGKKAGSFGDLATFSYYFTHHISTIEGGMILTDNDKYADMARAMRAFGWTRDINARTSVEASYPEIDPRFLFTNIGYNLRPTEIQGAFGIHQMKKLEGFIESRRENALYFNEHLGRMKYFELCEERPGTRHVWHHYPLTISEDAPFSRKDLMAFLESRGLETRPVVAGNIDEQPVMKLLKYRKVGDLPNARAIHRRSFLFGVHPDIGQVQREAIVSYFQEFLGGY